MTKLIALMSMALIALLAVASPALANGDGWYGDHSDRGRHRDNDTFRCNGVFTGKTFRDVEVPANKSCTLIDSRVRDDVEVRSGAYFQSTDTSIADNVQARGALTLFIDSDSTVGGDVLADRTAQVYVFNSKIYGGIGVLRATEVVNICGNTVKGDGIGVVRSSTDIIVGDPLALDCAGNTITRGDMLLWDNFTEAELIVRGNNVLRGSMWVLDNDGPSDKFVESNTGGRSLRCRGNDAPFLGAGNLSWDNYSGQCSA